ncbi:hypothetical protein [Flavobacterium microcysteis]|uniref:Chromosome partitioning protein ParA n=1 Tax=Flavobacterium microcysteis TaxID=2596891 RepID=A0A501PXJ0_9FLAO|nr:hypothetical protein [Flavobacterium microcysteis]TPD65289.1 hypothetical protein FJA49_13885 [Flavobacterium microcysteis]
MSFKPAFSIVNITAIISILTAAALAVELYSIKTEKEDMTHNVELDRKLHNNEISEILVRYDAALQQNMQLKKELEELKNKTVQTDDSVRSNLNMLKENISVLTKEKYTKSSQLETLNNILRLKQQDFENNKKEIEKLYAKINQLESEILASSEVKVEKKKLRASNVSAIGARTVSEKVLETKKTKNTEQIKVCFTLEDNMWIERGIKEIFIQIINPKANIVSKNKSSIEIKNQTLFYSAKTSVDYDKGDVDVCVFVDANKQHLIKGNYTVNIFSGAHLIGNTSLLLL